MTGMRFDTVQDLTAAMREGRIGHAQGLDLMKHFEPQAATQGAHDVTSLAASIPATTAQHAPALETLSKMITSGQCDAKDIAAKLKAGVKPEFLAAHGGMDMGEAVVAAMAAEQKHIHKPTPKIETRAEAVEAIKKFEKPGADMGDKICATMLREQFRIDEVLS